MRIAANADNRILASIVRGVGGLRIILLRGRGGRYELYTYADSGRGAGRLR